MFDYSQVNLPEPIKKKHRLYRVFSIYRKKDIAPLLDLSEPYLTNILSGCVIPAEKNEIKLDALADALMQKEKQNG